jgi:uncharacterized protein (DUF2126 family)
VSEAAMAFIKAKKTAWNTERGMALLYEDDPKHGVIIPIDALPPLGAHARRVIAGVQARKGQTTKTYDWRYAHPLKEDAFAVETMRADTGDTIVLVIDPKTELETSFSMTASTALALGRRLIEAGEGDAPPAPVKSD